MATMIAAAVDAVNGVQTELAIFFIAICLHGLLFGSHRFKASQKPKKVAGGIESSLASAKHASTSQELALIRCVKKLVHQNASRKVLAQELGAKVQANTTDKVNSALVATLESMGKSSSAELLGAVRDVLHDRNLPMNSLLSEMLLRSYLSMHMNEEFLDVLAEVEASDTASEKIMVLAIRYSLDSRDFDGAMGHLDRLGTLVSAQSTRVSSMPQLVVQQFAQQALSNDSLPAFLRELARCGFLTASAFEAALVEGSQKLCNPAYPALLREIEQLALVHNVELTDKASGVLVRAAHTGEDAMRIFSRCTQQGAVGRDSMLAALDASATHCSKALAESVVQHLPKTVAPEVGSALLCSLVEGPLRSNNTDETILHIYEKHLTGVDILLDLRAGRLIAEIALRQNRQDVLEQMLCASDNARRIALIRSFASDGRLADVTALFRACLEKTTTLYNAVLDACIDCQDTKFAEQIKDETVADGKADVVTYNLILKMHLQSGDLQLARELVKRMHSVGGTCAPNSVTFNELIGATARHGIQGVWKLIDEMQACGVQPTGVTVSMLLKNIQHTSTAAEVERTISFVNKLVDGIDEVLLGSICEACIRAERPDVLAAQLLHLRDVQISGPRSFGSIIRAHGYLNDLRSVWAVWNDMRNRKIVPTDVTIGCMVEALVSNSDVEGGYKLIRELSMDPQTQPLLNAIVYCSVLKGFCHLKCFKRVWEVYDEMKKAKLQFTIVQYNALIDACARSSEMFRVQPLMEDMARQNIEPNLVTYSTIIKGYCTAGRLNQAFELFEAMKKAKGLQPDEIAFNTLIDGCGKRGLYEQGMRVLDEMLAAGIRPSAFTLTVLAKLASRGNRPEKAFELVEELSQKYNVKLNSHVFANLVQAALSTGSIGRAVEVLQRMGRERVRPDARTYKLIIDAFLQAGKLPEAAGLIRVACGVNGEQLPASLKGLASASRDLRLKGGLPQEALKGFIEAILGHGGTEHLAVQLCKDLRATPGLHLDPRVSRAVTAQALRAPTGAAAAPRPR